MQSEYITQSRIKGEFGLTDKHIRLLGEPDTTRPNPHYRKGAPMKLYLRSRVEQWVAEHQDEIAASQPRKQSAQKAVNTKRESAKEEIASVVKELKLKSINRKRVLRQAADFFFARYEDFDGIVTEKGLCSYIRHNYTNYEEILSMVKGKVGASELYQNVKVYLCCRIVRHYELNIDPLYAAFGEAVEEIPKRFLLLENENLEDAVAALIGLDVESD